MEILILQYALSLLICLWWIKPFANFSLGKRLKIPLFNLLCIVVIFFIGSYTLIHEIRPANGVTGLYSILFMTINMMLFVLVPLSYLYLRNQVNRQPVRKKDMLHALPAALFALCFVLPYFIYGKRFAAFESKSGFFFTMYGYCIIGIYILLLMKFLLVKYLPLLDMKKKKNNGIGTAENGTMTMEAKVNEVLVGSVHLDAEQLGRMDETLRTYFLTQQPFLKRGYNLKQLADDISIPLHHLSAFINQYYHIHFNDLVNEYRVQYCQVKIRNDEWRSKTLEAIAEESGFNNRNTFTAAFKKVTGCNPSDFLKMVKQHQIAS